MTKTIGIPQDLKNTYYYVDSLEESHKLQKAMFKMGFRWIASNSGQPRKLLNTPVKGYIYVDKDCRMYQTSGAEPYALPINGEVCKPAFQHALYEISEHFHKQKGPKRKASRLKKSGWIANTTGKEPTGYIGDPIGEVRFRNGVARNRTKLSTWAWGRGDGDYIITHYRLTDQSKDKTVGKWIDREVNHDAPDLSDVVSITVKLRDGSQDTWVDDGIKDLKFGSLKNFDNIDYSYCEIVAYKINKLKEAPATVSLEKMLDDVVADAGGTVTQEIVVKPVFATQEAAVGDVNSDARGSGARYNAGKPDLSLIPLQTMLGEARVWGYGAKKYKAWNWMKGMDWNVPLACALRHLSAWQAGQDKDPETGESHLDHVLCNIRMLRYYEDNYKEGDNRPKQFFEATVAQ